MKTNAGQASRLGGGLLWRALAAAILALTFALVPQAALADEPTVLTAQSDGNYTSVEFVPVEPLVLTSGKEGYPVKDEVSGETWEYFEWFSFPREGDILRFTADDGSKKDYTFLWDSREYTATDGSVVNSWWDGGQSADNPWTPDKPGTITIHTMGLECTFPVTILPNPVESIAFEPKAPYVLHEGVDGMEEVDNYDDGDITWFKYDEPRVKDGDTLTVNLTNGSTKTYHFDGNAGVFVSDDNPSDVIEQECEGNGGYSFWGDQYARNQWSIDNPGTMKMTYYGHSVTVPVTIVPSSLDPADDPTAWSMSYEPVSPLVVGVEDMVLTWCGPGQDRMEYEFPMQTGDVLVLKHSESGEEIRYRLDYQEDGNGTFTNVDDPEDTFYQYELGIEWSDDDQGFWLDYWNWQILVTPTIDNHVTDIIYTPVGPYVLIEDDCSIETEYTYDDDGNEVELTYGAYRVNPCEGDTLVVTYDDNTQRTFTYSWGDSGLVFQDEKGTLPGYWYISDDQSYENQWGVGEHTVTYWYAGCSCAVPVVVEANNVASISYTPRKAELVEGVDGMYFPDEGYTFYSVGYQRGDTLAVDLTNGNTVTYRYEPNNGAWQNVDDATDAFDWGDVRIDFTQSSSNPWGVGPHEFTVAYHGRTCTVLVEVVANRVKSISLEPLQQPLEYVEGRDGVQRQTIAGSETITWTYYPPYLCEGDQLIVTTTDDATLTYAFQNYDPSLDYSCFVNVDDPQDIIYDWDFSWRGSLTPETWQIGEHSHVFYYAGCSCEVPVVVKAGKAEQTVTVEPLTLVYGQTATLQASTTGDGTLSYVSSDPTVATVSEDGVVKAAGVGTTQITVLASETDSFQGASAVATVTVNKASSSISLNAQTKTYNGKAQAYSGKVTKSGSTGKVTYDYYSDAKCTKSVKAASVKGAKTYYVKATLAADANHKAAKSAAVKFTIKKAPQPMTVTCKKPTVKASSLKKKDQTIAVTKAFTVSKNQGAVTYKKKSGSARLTISKDGKITFKKGTHKKGSYSIVVAVKAAGNANYNAGGKNVTVTVVVK